MKELEKKIIGENLAEILNIEIAKGDFQERRYITMWGTKTALGLYETVKRILTDRNEYKLIMKEAKNEDKI